MLITSAYNESFSVRTTVMPKQALRLILVVSVDELYCCPNDRYAETGIETPKNHHETPHTHRPNDRYAETGIETPKNHHEKPHTNRPNDRYAETGIETPWKISMPSPIKPSERPLCRNRH